LGLSGELVEEWRSYVGLLCENHISLDNDLEDTLCWSRNPKGGFFTAKLGYEAWKEEMFVGEKNGGGFRCGSQKPLLDAK
jgi:hypothetical protein